MSYRISRDWLALVLYLDGYLSPLGGVRVGFDSNRYTNNLNTREG